MRALDLFLILLLCFAIPLQGIADMVVTKTPCPAEATSAMMTDAGSDHACCNDADTVTKTGKPCKAEKDCQPTSPGMINLIEAHIAARFGGEKITIAGILASDFQPSAAWRPPTVV